MSKQREQQTGGTSRRVDPSVSVAANLEYALRRVSKQAAQYEGGMKDLESKLSRNLSNFRAIDSLLSEAFSGLQRNTNRADRAMNQQVPNIHRDLQESKEALGDLGKTLPTVQTQVQDIHEMYESGRRKGQVLVKDLEWLNTDWYERWRLIIFTSSSPVSLKWKITMRTLERQLADGDVDGLTMDGFDDLLAPSRKVLESNPFADDFGGTSSSDPWATPFGAPSHDDPFSSSAFGGDHNDPYAISSNPYADLTSTGNHVEVHEPGPREEVAEPETPVKIEELEEVVQESSDPLDSAAVAGQDDEEDNRPLGILRTPGFRESVAAPLSAPSPVQSLSPTAEETTPKPTVASPSEIQAQQSSAIVVSPLEGPTDVLENSLAGLSLGGDSLGGFGWNTQTHDSESWGQTELPPPPSTTTTTTTVRTTDDDSDDDKPINQTLKRASQDDTQPPISPSTAKPDNGLQPVFVITVDDPQKVGDPIRAFTMYTVHTRTTSPLFQKSAFSVLRRYSDFVWLYETLCHNNPGVVVPPVPEKNAFGRFEDQFLRQRRLALEKCITKIANHPTLGKDADLRLFLESDTFSLDMKHRKSAPSQDKGGLFGSIGASLVAPRFHETDEWFDRQKSYLDSLESQLRGLVRSIELVAKQRQELSVTIGEFAQQVSDLSASDVGRQLSVALGELAEVERKAQDMQSTQSEEDCTTIMATVDEYARLINSVRAAFQSRIRVYYAWKNAENDLLRTKQNHEKNRAQGRIPTERLGFSLNQVAEAERRVLEAKHEYDHVCKLVKTEVSRFEQERIDDFKDSLHAFLEGMISRQKELITMWENYQQILLKRVGGGGGGSGSAVSAQDAVS